MASWRDQIRQLDEWRFEIPRDFRPGMNVPGLIFSDPSMMEHIFADGAHTQVANVACLPGIVNYSLAMPDIHLGYGFAIGGVAAFDPEAGGIISPGGVGYDINCGVRMLRTDIESKDITGKLERIANELMNQVPSGVGSEGPISFSKKQLDEVLVKGSKWAVAHGYGIHDDLAHTEEAGAMAGADPEAISNKAKERGTPQAGTLGSGNHFLEVQEVQEIYDESWAAQFGLFKGQVTIMIHSGSRGLGHQVCTDYISVMGRAAAKYKIALPDRQLCCAPINSEEGRDYFAAMAGAANYAWCNRQVLMHWTRESFAKVLGGSFESFGIRLVYDVAHNIAKMEEHEVRGGKKILCVHRKGATRAFPGQPVIVPGDMGRCSYIMVGAEGSMKETFGSVCHGAGRAMSRTEATRKVQPDELLKRLEGQGIKIRTASRKGLVEEAPEAYKDVREVVNIVDNAGLAKKVAKMRPLVVIKG